MKKNNIDLPVGVSERIAKLFLTMVELYSGGNVFLLIDIKSNLFTKQRTNSQTGYSERPIGHQSQLHLR